MTLIIRLCREEACFKWRRLGRTGDGVGDGEQDDRRSEAFLHIFELSLTQDFAGEG